jgi:hypothetical protein
MKRMFTLLFAVGIIAAAEAQPGSRDNRQPGQRNHQSNDRWDDDKFDNDRNVIDVNLSFDRDDRFHDSRFSNERKRDMMIAKINREYDYRIQRVRNSYYLNRWEKMQKIRFLEDRRRQEIREVYMRFGKRNHYDRPDRRY